VTGAFSWQQEVDQIFDKPGDRNHVKEVAEENEDGILGLGLDLRLDFDQLAGRNQNFEEARGDERDVRAEEAARAPHLG